MTDQSLPGPQVDAKWSSGTPAIATSGAAWVRGRQWGSGGHGLGRAAGRTDEQQNREQKRVKNEYGTRHHDTMLRQNEQGGEHDGGHPNCNDDQTKIVLHPRAVPEADAA